MQGEQLFTKVHEKCWGAGTALCFFRVLGGFLYWPVMVFESMNERLPCVVWTLWSLFAEMSKSMGLWLVFLRGQWIQCDGHFHCSIGKGICGRVVLQSAVLVLWWAYTQTSAAVDVAMMLP